MRLPKTVLGAAFACAAMILLCSGEAAALKVGDQIGNVNVRDANDNPAKIPDLGKKVLVVFYTDPDVKDQNEPWRDMLKAAKLDKSKYRGLGVANLKDTWKPNFIIRSVIRKKIKKFKSTILTDKEHTLKDSWKLDDCNEKDVAMVIGTDQRIKYIKMGPMSVAEQKKALQLVKDLMARGGK